MIEYFIQTFIYLCAAVVSVPIAKRFGLGSVLGYLIAGVIIGPVVGLVGSETTTIQHFAEFGVVMMLFLVGLELEPRMLWRMRTRLLGLGGLQVGLTITLIAAIAVAFGQSWNTAITISLIFSLSSTAIVLQTFNEKNLTKTEGANTAFSVLLFQDIAVIPMLAFIPLLAIPELASVGAEATAGGHHEELSLVSGLSGWLYALVVGGAVAGVVFGGHYLSRPLFKFVANAGLREVFTAATLLLIIGIAALMSLVGLSPALGTFLAGVVLANSEFRHELESNIEPFKGLLLGLFFITVGAGIDFGLLSSNTWQVLAMTLGVMLGKGLVLFILALLFKVQGKDRWLFTLSLAQAGEFGFVLLNFSVQSHVLPPEMSGILSLVVALSMFLTPGLFILFDHVIRPAFDKQSDQREPDVIEERGLAIIAGIGRFGQIVNRLLVANKVNTVVLDYQAGQIDLMRKINVKSYFGDATRPELLHTAGIEQARLFVVAIDQKEPSIELVKYLKHTYPNLKVLARAFDRGHSYALRMAGADYIVSETYYSALEMGRVALENLGMHPFRAEQVRVTFDELERRSKDHLFEIWKKGREDNRFTSNYREVFIEFEKALSEAMQEDRRENMSRTDRMWNPPPKRYVSEVQENLDH
ncbi:monovalent cation:proton antiporter-2 (CPA2) family protein [Pseudobacteriovorax antillogorgiicola]|uniref:Kef-type potassium/proton antiporter, CPA2 family n=1 Tax=Pseudobacteriovorax antillogorgiicola TaxID=1513793 RepID=A0A1Y6BTC7_9BACT|nr:monovalent cation:proton antiporter-2 (CPA2) family protein [Pseudobacteriovorax antillogorgiicola]TCS53051.1 Kef-type potassium/proton antiporter (CPA2 family) [Pseudobacteriovorax antillogorgiicola]SMF26415.1 Kef-type potassium/proton antiporter, CPA2 family [Pseudobacteriovorax antillogorgiicola]